jgi:hypothetical protein
MKPLLRALSTRLKTSRGPLDDLDDAAVELAAYQEGWVEFGVVAKCPEDIRAFGSLADAIEFIANCLETDAVVSLAAEIETLEARLDALPNCAYSFPEGIFFPLKAINEEKDLRSLFRGRDFPDGDVGFALGGHFSELGNIHIFFVKRDRGWVIRDMWLTRQAPSVV